ncbi:MAG TPA: hypothetical protein VMJ66_11725 [Geobacteraceae bacterium]|nr:hypothetical protein [Geobacteraceae bacterium]
MISERVFNSLQYRLSLEEKEWRAKNKLRKELALTPFHRFLLVIGRRPVFWGILLLIIVLIFSLLLAVADLRYWTIIEISKFHVNDPSAYFTALWSVQAAIAALVYPIVIAFVTVLLQLSNNAKADLYIYLHNSSATPAGLSALLLIITMGIQYCFLPYFRDGTVFSWTVIDAIWFAFNCAITIRFLLQTFNFILPSSRDEIVRRYSISVAWPAEVRGHLAKHIFENSVAAGLIPGPHNAEQKGAEPSILPGQYGFKHGEPVTTLLIKREKELQDIRFRILSWVITRWKERAALQSDVAVFEIPLTPLDTYEGEVVLASLQGQTSLNKWEKRILRQAFVFGSPKRKAVELSINDVLSGIQGCAKSSIRSGQFDRFESELTRMTNIYLSLIESSDVIDTAGNIFSLSEVGDRDHIFRDPVFQRWSRNFIDLFADAAKRIGEDPSYIIHLSIVPNQLFNAAKNHSTLRMPLHFLLLSHIILRRIEDWWTDAAERLGNTEHSAQKPIVLPAPHSRNHEQVMRSFISRWENYIKFQFLSEHGEGAKWTEFLYQSEFFASHIMFTIISLFDCLLRGDRIGTEWMADVLVKWYSQIEYRLSKAHYYLYRHQKFFTIEMCRMNWDVVEQLLNKADERIVGKPTPFGVFTSCLHNLWEDAEITTLALLADWNCGYEEESRFLPELFGSIINGKSLRPGEDTRQQKRLIANFNELLVAILRQHYSEYDGDSKYGSRLNKIVDDVRELSRTEMVSGRVYVGWGRNDLSSVDKGDYRSGKLPDCGPRSRLPQDRDQGL